MMGMGGGATGYLVSGVRGSGLTTDVADAFGDGSSIATFPLNGNATTLSGLSFTGSSGNLNGDTNSGNFSSSGGKFGQYWIGSGTTHLTTNHSSASPSGAYSLSFWYNSSTTGQNNKRLLTVKGAVVTTGWNNYDNSLGFYIGTGSNTTSVNRVAQIPDSAVNDGSWHHLVYTTTSNGTWKIYLDGSQYNNPVSGEGRSFNSGSTFAVTTYDGGDSYNTICKIDQIRFFNRVITSSEVTILYGETE